MAHEISIRKNGMAEMGYAAGTDRWHGLGNEWPENASIDDCKKIAGMEWRVLRSKERYMDNEGALHVNDDQHVLFRSDTKARLASVSAGFKVVQPGEALEFFRDLCEHNHFKMRTAGVLYGGRRYWALADIGEESFVIDPRDRVKGRLLFATACDGSMKSIAKYVAECVVCSNTQRIALAEDGKESRTSHRSVFNASDVKAKLGLAAGQWNGFIEQARVLAKRPIDMFDASDRTVVLLNGGHLHETGKAYEDKIAEVQASRGYKKIMELFSGAGLGSAMPGREDTLWGWVNAVTEYVDHHAPARNVDNRFNSSQFGDGDELKSEAMAVAMELV